MLVTEHLVASGWLHWLFLTSCKGRQRTDCSVAALHSDNAYDHQVEESKRKPGISITAQTPRQFMSEVLDLTARDLECTSAYCLILSHSRNARVEALRFMIDISRT